MPELKELIEFWTCALDISEQSWTLHQQRRIIETIEALKELKKLKG